MGGSLFVLYLFSIVLALVFGRKKWWHEELEERAKEETDGGERSDEGAAP